MPARLEISIQNHIACVALNRPDKRNALDIEMFQALVKAQKQIKADKSLRAVILSGRGEDFCSGLDIKSIMSNKLSAIRLLWKWLPGNANLAQKVSLGWRRLPLPVIAAIDGRCWGGGLQIALGADYRIASHKSSFSIMESKWGLIPDMAGSLALRDCMSKDQAMKLAMSAEMVDAEQALALKLISEIAADPIAAAEDFAKAIAQKSPDSIKAIKKLYHQRWQGSERQMLAGETLAQWKILLGQNQKIAVKRQQGKDIAFKD